nr:zinc finger BED domain-containing protein RICESLEEPER 2-like [Ipomoea batatas]
MSPLAQFLYGFAIDVDSLSSSHTLESSSSSSAETWKPLGSTLGTSDRVHRDRVAFESYLVYLIDLCVNVLECVHPSKTSHPSKSTICASLDAKQMQMSLRDLKNKINCGMYLIHHMETYVEQGLFKWDCGLTKGDTSKLHKLRLQYMKDIVVSEYNAHRSTNLARAYQHILGPVPSI